MKTITEGKAKIVVNEGVFYNPKMTTLRDISVAFIKTQGKGKRIIDCTSATGIRGIRYALETNPSDVVMLDINEDAWKNSIENIRMNGLRFGAFNVSVQECANTNKDKYNIIDLDPFGSPAPCLYDAIKLATNDTILMVTATDTAVLCGAHGDACIKVYNAKPLHTELCKEAGLRILLGFILRNASQFNMGIEPLLSISDMHYMRVFVRLKVGAAQFDTAFKEMGSGTYCQKCKSFSKKNGVAPIINPKCYNCNNTVTTFGPLWLGKLQDIKLLKQAYNNSKKISELATKQLEMILKEHDTFMFYSIPQLTKSIGKGAVSPILVIEKLKKKGYKATRTQFEKDGIKTDAPIKAVIRAVR